MDVGTKGIELGTLIHLSNVMRSETRNLNVIPVNVFVKSLVRSTVNVEMKYYSV